MRTVTTPYEALLLASAVKILKSDPRKDEHLMNNAAKHIDDIETVCCNQYSQIFNPAKTATTQKEPIMAKAGKLKSLVNSVFGANETIVDETPEPGTVITNEDGSTEAFNPPAIRDLTKQELKDAKKAAAAAKKVEREERLAELGKNYKGSMLALADKVKSGSYVKSITGQLHSNDDLAQALNGVNPNGVIQLGKELLSLHIDYPYNNLNAGQQSMNLRNRMRGALKKGTLTIALVKKAVVDMNLDSSTEIKIAAEAKAKRIAHRTAKSESKTKEMNLVE